MLTRVALAAFVSLVCAGALVLNDLERRGIWEFSTPKCPKYQADLGYCSRDGYEPDPPIEVSGYDPVRVTALELWRAYWLVLTER